jgi:hypothetical protein
MLRNLWFLIRYGEKYHQHQFKRVASDTWCCEVGHCNCWYGEDVLYW